MAGPVTAGSYSAGTGQITRLADLEVDSGNSIDPILGRLIIGSSPATAPGSTLNTNQVNVTTATAPATTIIAANTSRYTLTIKNTDAANPIFIGGTNAVTSATGHRLAAGGTLTLSNYKGAVYACSTGGAVVITYLEEAV